MPSLAAKVLVVPHHTNWVLLSPGSTAVEEAVATEEECECAPSSQFEGQVASLPVPHLRVPLGIPAAPLLIQLLLMWSKCLGHCHPQGFQAPVLGWLSPSHHGHLQCDRADEDLLFFPLPVK